ncbi:MAG: flagellar basal body rod protein FlgC [Deferribacteraceae bacterium]|jgi:flagellar basal-body rod protein FlgC|nr:flagellar basal body rod protein FlgC [Deferribacteraceae bacterium]
MSFFNILDVASTGLSAQRIRINVIASNMANANTTRTEAGGPYRKKNVVFEQVLRGEHRGGVKVKQITPDLKPASLRYEPGHPDANEEGYVAYPNINPVEELVNMLEASRSYEANVTMVTTAKQLAQSAIGIASK